MHTVLSKRWKGGFTRIELAVIIALLGAVAVINGMFVSTKNLQKTKIYRVKCSHNLGNLGVALQTYAADHQNRYPMQLSTNQGGSMEFVNDGIPVRHFMSLSNEFNVTKSLLCPADAKRKAAPRFSSLECANLSYFIGLNATVGQPASMLAGDRNLTMSGLAVRPGI